MLTIISFILTLAGSVNWLMIGLLQYDFVAGIFGFQASVFSRLIYIVIGASAGVLIFKLIKGRGTLAVLSKRNKQDVAKKIEKMQNKNKPAYDVESSYENLPHEEYFQKKDEHQQPSRGLFDEHFDKRDDL